MSEEPEYALRDIARLWVTGEIFVDAPALRLVSRGVYAPEDDEPPTPELEDAIRHATQEFLFSWPIVALAESDKIPKDIGGCWEFMSKASPRAVNGWPMFFSCHILTLTEIDEVTRLARQMHEAMNRVGDESDS